MWCKKSAVILSAGVVATYVAGEFLTAAAGKQIDDNLQPPPAASVVVVSSTTTFMAPAFAYDTITDEQRDVTLPAELRRPTHEK